MADDQVRWLDESEAAAWLPLLSVALWLPGALDQQLQRDQGLSGFEYAVLAQLSQHPSGRAPMSDLARASNSTLPRLSKVTTRLESQGWMRRRPDPANGRVRIAELTESGWDKVRAAAPGHVAHVRRLVFDHLEASEVAALGSALQRIAAAVGPDGASAGRFGA